MFEKVEKHKKACPVCGKMNTLVGYHPKRMLLDGIPDLPMKKYLAQYAMCNQCGCVYHYRSSTHDEMVNAVRSDEYQKIWKSDTEPTLKKLRLMAFFPYSFANVEHCLFHYYHEHNRKQQARDALLKTIDYIQQGRIHDSAIFTNQICKEFKINRYIEIYDHMYLVDLYRQAGMFDKATQLIASFKGQDYLEDTTNIMNYLNREADLIKAKDAQQH